MSDPRLVIDADRALAARILELSRHRMVFFAGLPGTGKSLLVHQLAHLASSHGRRVRLLQWDVARPVFEASPAGQRYPVIGGVTHPVIRKAAGLWVRQALVDWDRRHAAPEHLVIGETPFVGGRFVDLAGRADDSAEPLLAGSACRFAIAVPSRDVRRHLEAERERRAAAPLHAREREDAPPAVLRALWREIAEVGRRMGLASRKAGPGDEAAVSYDPDLYAKVYAAVLRYRNVEVVALDTILPTGALSVYDFQVPPADLVPTEADAERFIAEVEQRYRIAGSLEREIERWWEV